jgi:hypothetical protein
MIKLQILLHKPWRNAEGVERVRELIESMGMKPTSQGQTTLSAAITKKSFAEIFNTPVQEIASRPPSDADFGKSSGSVAGDLPVPKPLRQYVESITVASPYTRM